MDSYALALCGGGGKGAYQIGVWKALSEDTVIGKISAVSGTSVGALNAVLFSLGDFEKSKEIWYNINEKTLLSPNRGKGTAWCSRQGLKEIMYSLPISNLRTSLPVFVNIHNAHKYEVESVAINNLPVDEIIDVLLASSAMPFIYDSVEINGSTYIDGGWTPIGNVPIDVLYREGYRNIIISSLDSNFNIYHICEKKLSSRTIDVTNKYSGADFKILKPLEDLGDILNGTLDFSKTGIRNRMIDGYKDTVKLLRGEDIYFMKNEYSKINLVIKDKMEKLFHSRDELEDFLKTTNIGKINYKAAVLDGKVFYENVVELFGWKLQQHKVLGLKSHYRFVDHNSVRVLWVLDPEDILSALEDYEAVKKFL